MPYEILDVSPSGKQLFVTAFLDDDGNADPSNPEPSRGDLVAMEGISFPKVVMDQPQPYALDLTLNIAMPF